MTAAFASVCDGDLTARAQIEGSREPESPVDPRIPGNFAQHFLYSKRPFVWLGDSYPNGFYYFFADSWRHGPVPESTDTRYRPPRRGEFYPTDVRGVGYRIAIGGADEGTGRA